MTTSTLTAAPSEQVARGTRFLGWLRALRRVGRHRRGVVPGAPWQDGVWR